MAAATGGLDAKGVPLLCPWKTGFLSSFRAELAECNIDDLCEVRQAVQQSEVTAPVSANDGSTSNIIDSAPQTAKLLESSAMGQHDATSPLAHGTLATTGERLLRAGFLIVLGLFGLSCCFCACIMPSASSQPHKLYQSNHCKPD